MIKTLFKDIKLKDGTVLLKGLKVTVNLPKKSPVNVCTVITPDDKHYNLRITNVIKAPGIKALQNMVFDGDCYSINKCRCDPDGYDSEGYASWLLVLGMI